MLTVIAHYGELYIHKNDSCLIQVELNIKPLVMVVLSQVIPTVTAHE